MIFLDVVDMQQGFMDAKGTLALSEIGDLRERANRFFSQIPSNLFEFVLFKMDTHFEEEYKRSPESEEFPFHCGFDTFDWQLAVDPSLLETREIRTWFLLKNRFDFWQDTALISAPISLEDARESAAYQTLFSVIEDLQFSQKRELILRDAFFKRYPPNECEVYLMGVASDYCNRYAMEGYLQRGYRVTILEDLTCGIALQTGDVIAEECYATYRSSGKLRVMNSSSLLGTQ